MVTAATRIIKHPAFPSVKTTGNVQDVFKLQ